MIADVPITHCTGQDSIPSMVERRLGGDRVLPVPWLQGGETVREVLSVREIVSQD